MAKLDWKLNKIIMLYLKIYISGPNFCRYILVKKLVFYAKKGRIWVIHISGQYSYRYISVRKPLFYVKVRKPCIIYGDRFFTNIYLQKCSIFTWKGSFLWSRFLRQKQNDSYSSFITNLSSDCEVRSYCQW